MNESDNSTPTTAAETSTTKAVVALRPGKSTSAEELIAFCAERIADYKKPRSVDFVDELPRNPSGKLLKNQIRAPYWTGTGRNIYYFNLTIQEGIPRGH